MPRILDSTKWESTTNLLGLVSRISCLSNLNPLSITKALAKVKSVRLTR